MDPRRGLKLSKRFSSNFIKK